MNGQDARPPRASPAWWVGLLFWLGTFCLWIPPVLLLWLALGGSDGMSTFYGAVGILEFGIFVTPAGFLMLVAYAFIGRPWRRPLGTVWIFWAELVIFVLLLPQAIRFLLA